ncbi:MAG TPA: tetratricopeptide repeat protein [Candidatus Polarisedimenticolaceae bacterium]|nr:tetratricopeptide repeat protein [Candidatus Polarisedimenticolaceae bacterium]
MSVLGRSLAVLALAASCLPARADRLHLAGGGVLDVERWWIEGNTLVYESAAGTVGLPRASVVRIETRDAPAPSPPPSSPKASPPPRRAADTAVREGAEALVRRDLETAEARFTEALRLDADRNDARVGLAVASLALGRDEAALAHVLDGLAREPRNPDLHELLGDLRDREERTADALAEWRQAFQVAPSDRLRDKILKAEREQSASGAYAFSAAPHFNLRFDGKVDEGLADEIGDYLEDAWRDLADLYRHTPEQPITVLLYPTQSFREVTQTAADVAGLFDGKIRVPLGGLTRLNPSAKAVLLHELSHAVVHAKTRGNCPRWLQEGLAQRAEGRRPTDADRQEVRRRLEKGDPARWEDAGFSYAVALSLVRALEEDRGFHALLDVLERLGAGANLDQALTEVYGEGHAALCRRFAEHVRDGAAP